MEFNTLSGSENFIEERDFRLELLESKELFPYLCQKVLINGKPVKTRTAKNAFKVDSFNQLKRNTLAIWLESEDIIKKILKESNVYTK